MRRIAGWLGIALLIAFGGALVMIYALTILTAADRGDAIQANGSLGGIGLAFMIAGFIWLSLRVRRSGSAWYTQVQFPPVWIGLIIFAVAVAIGFAMTESNTAMAFTPVMAVLALVGVAAVVGRFVGRWAPGNRVRADTTVRAVIWGMVGAPGLAVIAQIAVVSTLIVGLMAGLSIADRDLVSEIQPTLENYSGNPNSLSGDLLTTPTVIFAVYALVAVMAPLTEELFKGLGVVLVMARRRTITPYRVFTAGVAAGLGFALVEALGYSLATPDNWQTVMLVRAPVVIIHVASTALVAMGWYLQQYFGGWNLLWYYLFAVVLHAAWNSLSVALLVTGANIEDMANPDAASAVVMLVIMAALGAVLAGSFTWVVAVARKLAPRTGPSQHADMDRHEMVSGFDTGTTISYPR